AKSLIFSAQISRRRFGTRFADLADRFGSGRMWYAFCFSVLLDRARVRGVGLGHRLACPPANSEAAAKYPKRLWFRDPGHKRSYVWFGTPLAVSAGGQGRQRANSEDRAK